MKPEAQANASLGINPSLALQASIPATSSTWRLGVCFRFWQKGAGFDRKLFTPEALEASIDYIHNNPVKRELCEKATDWIWSSSRFYLLEPSNLQFPELPHLHGLPQVAFDPGQPN